jgi:hypothetical protein
MSVQYGEVPIDRVVMLRDGLLWIQRKVEADKIQILFLQHWFLALVSRFVRWSLGFLNVQRCPRTHSKSKQQNPNNKQQTTNSKQQPTPPIPLQITIPLLHNEQGYPTIYPPSQEGEK